MTLQAAFLPPQVRDLVCYNETRDSIATSELQDLAFLDDCGLLVAESIQQCLPLAIKDGPIATEIDPLDLIPFKRSCVFVFSDLKRLTSNNTVSLQALYADQLDWMGSTGRRASEIWFNLYAKREFSQAWLVGSIVLEQLIGNVIYTVQGSEKFIPFLVRDLLGVPCLNRYINRTLIRVIKTMIGSPFTLNIRNLLWHGFIIPRDDIPLDAYGAMLIAVTMSIAHSAKKTLDSPLIIRHSNPKSFYGEQPKQDQIATSLSEFDRIFNAIAYGPMPPPVDCSHLSGVLYSLVQKSLFVTPGTLDQWIVACRHLNPESSSSFVFTMSTLPLIEHALRLVYVATNQCKQDRTSALIAGEYYLTLDVILDKAVPVEYFESDSGVLLENADHENIQNKLFLELETSIMNLMYDLFILGLGPRLRDRTSHGELNSYLTLDVTKEAWFGYYIGLVVYLLYKYLPGNSEEIPEGVKQYILWKDQYSEYRFDERSIVKRETSRCQMLLAKYVQFLSSSTVGSEEAVEKSDSVSGIEIVLSFDGNAIFTKLESFSGKVPLESLLSESLSAWSSSSTMLHKGPTASRFSSNLPAWILIVQGVQNAIEKVTTKIRTFSEQLALRQLSSRSRKQFENMKPLIPRLLGMLIGCLAIVERVVLTQDENLKVSFSGSTEGIEARLEEKGPSKDSRIDSDNASVGIVDKSSKEEIMLRLKITTFVDKFISNFDSVKLNLIEPAWKELKNSVELLLEGKASSK